MRFLAVLISLLTLGPLAFAQPGRVRKLLSPDRSFQATVQDTYARSPKFRESVVSVHDASGKLLRSYSFTSTDRQHGAVVVDCEWSPDGHYFVVRMEHTGGHQPQFQPIVIWSRDTNAFYELTRYTADKSFSIALPDQVTVLTWPAMNPTTIRLKNLRFNEFRELK